MPLTAKTFSHKFKSEDGSTDESITFRYPSTLERIDAVAEMQRIYGSVEAADADKDELAERFGMEKVRELVDWCQRWGRALLCDACVGYAQNGKPEQNISEIDGWQRLIADDLYYGDQLQAGMLAFFRDVLAVRLGGEA